MNKNKKMLIGGFSVIVLLVLFDMLFLKKDDNINSEEIVGFKYYSGSSSVSEKFVGIRNKNEISIELTTFDGGKQNFDKFVIDFGDFRELLNKTKTENCKKHTSHYQCGESMGCSYSSFSVSFENNDNNVCYEINDDVSDFFENLYITKW